MSRLLGFRLLVQQDPPPALTRSGLHLPTIHAHPSATGTIVAVGTKLAEKYPELKVGGKIALRPYSGNEYALVEWEGKMCKLLEGLELEGVLGLIERP